MSGSEQLYGFRPDIILTEIGAVGLEIPTGSFRVHRSKWSQSIITTRHKAQHAIPQFPNVTCFTTRNCENAERACNLAKRFPVSEHAIAELPKLKSISQHAIATPKPAIAGNFLTCSRAEGFFCNSALRVGIADCKIANCKIAVLNRVHVDCRIADCGLHVVKSAPDV